MARYVAWQGWYKTASPEDKGKIKGMGAEQHAHESWLRTINMLQPLSGKAEEYYGGYAA